MAFDMFAGDVHECIDHHEEFIFTLAEAQAQRYPELLRIWRLFYDDPRLSAQQAGLLVHELIDLLAANGGAANKPLAHVVVRLLVFFSTAQRGQLQVNCDSD